MNESGPILAIYDLLLNRYGPQDWWPADSAFEMMVGAILTQNTSWTNVEKAIANLREAGLLDASAIDACDELNLAEAIRPSGFFNQKTKRLKLFTRFYTEHGGESGIRKLHEPRQALLAMNGIGPETADSMLLYALETPVFVIDAYTRRIFSRLGFTRPDSSYQALQSFFQSRLVASVPLFQEYHAQIVMHAKVHCQSKPSCAGCPLQDSCSYGRQDLGGVQNAT